MLFYDRQCGLSNLPPANRAEILQHPLHPCVRGERAMAGRAARRPGPAVRDHIRERRLKRQDRRLRGAWQYRPVRHGYAGVEVIE